MNQQASIPEHEPRAGGKPVAAVMVVGGGIAGMQASLDLANAGFKVYLVEKQSAIGGHMAQLDKTFPTNDCAMCTISPKLVEVGRHRNIEILTNTEVLGMQGTAGNFTVSLAQRARHIDPSQMYRLRRLRQSLSGHSARWLQRRIVDEARRLQALPSGDPECVRDRETRDRAVPRRLSRRTARSGLHCAHPRRALSGCVAHD